MRRAGGEEQFIPDDESSRILGIRDLYPSQDRVSLDDVLRGIAFDSAADFAAEHPERVRDVTVSLQAETVSDTSGAPGSEQARIREAAQNRYPMESAREGLELDFFDLSVTRSIDGNETETSRVLEIPLWYDMTGRHHPALFRFHGAASEMRRLDARPVDYQHDLTLDGSFYVSGSGRNTVLYLYTNRFSLYAVATFGPESYTVFFDPDGGTAVDAQTVTANDSDLSTQKASKPADPKKDGFVFDGWYLQNSDMQFDFDTVITEDTHLYAHWTAIPARSSGGGSSRRYAITVESIDNGSAETSVQQAYRGSDVRITVRPNPGFEVGSVTVKLPSGTEVSVTRNDDGTFHFTQPASSVVVEPVFLPVTAPVSPEPDDLTAQEQDDTSNTEPDNTSVYTTENPAPSSVTGADQWLITETHPAFISGFSDGTFRPNANISRAQAAVMFYRLLKNPGTTRTTSFSDMSGNEWYAEAVYTLSSMGIIQGYSDGSFHGNDTISRAAFAAIATRLSKVGGETGTGVTFSDVPSNNWAHDTIAQASYFGWIGGYSDGTFRPSDPITRAAVTAIINRMLNRNADQTYMTEYSGESKQFSDVQDPAAWYYFNVAEAATSHGFTVNDGKESWNNGLFTGMCG